MSNLNESALDEKSSVLKLTDHVVELDDEERLQKEQQEAINAELEYYAQTREDGCADFTENLMKTINMMKEKIPTANFVELKGFLHEISDCEKTLESFSSMYYALNGMNQMMETTARKVRDASLLEQHRMGYLSEMDRFASESKSIREEIKNLGALIEENLNTRYNEKEATARFLTEESITSFCNAIEERLKHINRGQTYESKEELLKAAAEIEDKEIQRLLEQIQLFEKREFIVQKFIEEVLFAPGSGHLRDLRKAKQALRGNYTETFKKTQKELVRDGAHTLQQLHIFEKGLLEHCNITTNDTIIFFTWLKRSIYDRQQTNRSNLEKSIINILIMNVSDIQAGIWVDEEMKLSAEQYMKSMTILLPVFQENANKTKDELLAQLQEIYCA